MSRHGWLVVSALALVVVGCKGRDVGALLKGPPEPWLATIRDTPLAKIAQVDSETAKRLIDSIGAEAGGNPVARAGLITALYHHPNQQIGASAAWYFAQLGGKSKDVFLPALRSGNQRAELRAAYGVGEVGVPAGWAVPALGDLLAGEHDDVAGMANWALDKVAPKLKDPSIDLIRLVRFQTGSAKEVAMYRAGWSGPFAVATFPILVRLLGDSSDMVRNRASEALSHAGEAARPALENGLRSPREQVRIEAMMLLSRLGSN